MKTHLPRYSAYILQISNNRCETLIALFAFSNQPYLKAFEEYSREEGNSFNEMREVRVKQGLKIHWHFLLLLWRQGLSL